MSRTGVPFAPLLVASVIACFAVPLPATAGEVESLSPKKDISEHWIPEAAPAEIWSVKDGVIICKGMPHGYIHTKKEYTNYIFKVEWRFNPEGAPPNPNSGVFLNVAKPYKLWPMCIEVQLMNPEAGSIFPLEGAVVKGAIAHLKDKAKPLGEWNSYEITVKDGGVALVFNGEKMNEGTDLEPRRGAIALQSEGWEVHFRNISIQDLAAKGSDKGPAAGAVAAVCGRRPFCCGDVLIAGCWRGDWRSGPPLTQRRYGMRFDWHGAGL